MAEFDPVQDHHLARIMRPDGPTYFGVLQGLIHSPKAKRPLGQLLWVAMVDLPTAVHLVEQLGLEVIQVETDE